MKVSPLLFFLVGILLVWLGVTGRLGVFLAAIFTPERVNVNG
jgi:hypothetical protein